MGAKRWKRSMDKASLVSKALRDVFRLRRAAECDPTYDEQQRSFAACRGVPTSGMKFIRVGPQPCGQSLDASRRNTSLRLGSCLSSLVCLFVFLQVPVEIDEMDDQGIGDEGAEEAVEC